MIMIIVKKFYLTKRSALKVKKQAKKSYIFRISLEDPLIVFKSTELRF